MKAFEFRLQRVADYRSQQLDIAKSRLETLNAQMRRLDDDIADLASQKANAESEVAARAEIRGEDLAALSSFKAFVARREVILKAQRAELAKKLAAQRAEVVEAERNVKLLDRLKDRRLQEWKSATDKELDELAADSHLARLAASR